LCSVGRRHDLVAVVGDIAEERAVLGISL